MEETAFNDWTCDVGIFVNVDTATDFYGELDIVAVYYGADDTFTEATVDGETATEVFGDTDTATEETTVATGVGEAT